MKIVSLNFEGLKHFQTLIAPWLSHEQPDVLCCQEFPQRELTTVEGLLESLGHFSPMIKVVESGKFVGNPPGWYGVALFVKRSLVSQDTFTQTAIFSDRFYLKENIDPVMYGPNSGWRTLVWADIPTSSDNHKKLRVATTHFTWAPGGGINDLQRRDFISLSKLLDEVKPDILCADFNAPRGGEIFGQLSKRFRDNIPPEVTTTLDQNLHRMPGLQLVVDGMFSRPNVVIKNVRAIDGLSDHCALVGEIG